MRVVHNSPSGRRDLAHLCRQKAGISRSRGSAEPASASARSVPPSHAPEPWPSSPPTPIRRGSASWLAADKVALETEAVLEDNPCDHGIPHRAHREIVPPVAPHHFQVVYDLLIRKMIPNQEETIQVRTGFYIFPGKQLLLFDGRYGYSRHSYMISWWPPFFEGFIRFGVKIRIAAPTPAPSH